MCFYAVILSYKSYACVVVEEIGEAKKVYEVDAFCFVRPTKAETEVCFFNCKSHQLNCSSVFGTKNPKSRRRIAPCDVMLCSSA